MRTNWWFCVGVLFSILLCALAGLNEARILHQSEAVGDDPGGGDAAFLSKALPLKIAITTPGSILEGSSPLSINGQQAITVSCKLN